MVRAHDLAGDARVLYGPLSQRPTPAEAGSGALWVDPADQTLYHVQSGNWVAVSASGGASAGTPVLYGPYVVDYTDIPHDGDTMTLWTPTLGDVLLKLFSDRQALTGWDHGFLFVGQNVDGTVSPPHNCFGQTGQTSNDPDGLPAFGALDIGWWGSDYDASGGNWITSAHVAHTTDPVQIQLAQTGGTDPTQGHVEIYALVARAVAP